MESCILGVAHFGIAVPKIEEAVEHYQMFGYQIISDGIVDENEQGVRACILKCGETVIELLAPLEEGKESPVDTYISTKPYKIYHIAYYVSDMSKAIEGLRGKKYLLMGEPKPSKLQGGNRTVFLASRKAGVVELIEK